MLQCNMQAVESANCRVARVNEKTSSERSIAIQYPEAPACTAGTAPIFKGAKRKHLVGNGIPSH